MKHLFYWRLKQQQNENKIKASQGKEELRKVGPRAQLAQKEEGEAGQLGGPVRAERNNRLEEGPDWRSLIPSFAPKQS